MIFSQIFNLQRSRPVSEGEQQMTDRIVKSYKVYSVLQLNHRVIAIYFRWWLAEMLSIFFSPT